MPTLWYSIEHQEFPFVVPFRTPLKELGEQSRARIAELCAKDFHEEYDGRASGWPVVVSLREQPGGPVISRHCVERELAPVFFASDLSAA